MSKADVNKIIELILSEDEANQELGMMMAVSQGLRFEVLNNIYEYMKVLGEKYAHVKRGSIDKIYTVRKSYNTFSAYNIPATYTEWIVTVVVRGGTEISVKQGPLAQVCNIYLKLKNYNYEQEIKQL